MLQSGGRVVALDSRQDMFTWRRVPMLGLQMGEQCSARWSALSLEKVFLQRGQLSAKASMDTSLVAIRSVDGERTHLPRDPQALCAASR